MGTGRNPWTYSELLGVPTNHGRVVPLQSKDENVGLMAKTRGDWTLPHMMMNSRVRQQRNSTPSFPGGTQIWSVLSIITQLVAELGSDLGTELFCFQVLPLLLLNVPAEQPVWEAQRCHTRDSQGQCEGWGMRCPVFQPLPSSLCPVLFHGPNSTPCRPFPAEAEDMEH